jgi:hypothetical protein
MAKSFSLSLTSGRDNVLTINDPTAPATGIYTFEHSNSGKGPFITENVVINVSGGKVMVNLPAAIVNSFGNQEYYRINRDGNETHSGSIFIKTPVQIIGLPTVLLSLWNGTAYPSYGAPVTDYRGPVEPTAANNGNRVITSYDQWFRSASGSASVAQSTVSLPSQGPIQMGTYTFTMPTAGIIDGSTVIFAFTFPASVAGTSGHSMTFNIADQTGGASRIITPVAAASQTMSGFSNWVYSFTATSLTPGSIVTIVRNGTDTNTGSVRCIPHVMAITGLTSSTPSVAAKGNVTQAAKHTTPSIAAIAANTIEISYMGDRDGTGPYTNSWVVSGSAITPLGTNSYGSLAPAHSSAIGWNYQPVPAGTMLGGRDWTATTSTGTDNTDSYGGGWTLGYTSNPVVEITAARFGWDASTSTWMQV